jgi:hypothetical protein
MLLGKFGGTMFIGPLCGPGLAIGEAIGDLARADTNPFWPVASYTPALRRARPHAVFDAEPVLSKI